MAVQGHNRSTQITVVMMTRNEAHNIKACLESLKDYSEVIVVDNGSTDETCEIIKSFSNTRLILSPWKGYGGTRQVGVDAAAHDWILWFDADERMTPELTLEIQEHLNNSPAAAVFSIPRRNFFLGQEIRGCGWSPDRVLRVFNRSLTRFDDKTVHEGLSTEGERKTVELKNAIVHYSYRTIRQFFQKNQNYAFLAADERARIGRKMSAWQLLLRPVWEFIRAYILKAGFRDGIRGLVICLGGAAYVFTRDSTRYFEDKK
ncbi:MAG: glycosyltransferase family 2 protein [Betaproteobacteria bacterium]|nr:glycosyltransferase family 2 protein [Betaproteobacteria bacterium]